MALKGANEYFILGNIKILGFLNIERKGGKLNA